MHSPEALAFSIRSPFPSMRRKVRDDQPQWKSPIYFRNGKLRTSCFMTLAGHEFYFDSWVDVWHYEPNGADSGTICKTKWYKDRHGQQRAKQTWKWHFWHYKVSFSLLYKWRRHLFTRCAECGGPSRKGHMVNHSDNGWYGGPKIPFWCGEINMYHSECMSKMSKRRTESIHTHEKATCWHCSGAASFQAKAKKREASKVAKDLFGSKP